MQQFLSRFLKPRNRLSEMSSSEVGEHLSRTFPKSVRHTTYATPPYCCSRWILLQGPAYADKGFVGTIVVETSNLIDWTADHSTKVFSSNVAEQQAREYLPTWFKNADNGDESITFLDQYQREVLQGYSLAFLWKDWAKVWCPTCVSWHQRIKEHDYKYSETGRISISFADWHCPLGHLINKEEPLKIKWIVR